MSHSLDNAQSQNVKANTLSIIGVIDTKSSFNSLLEYRQELMGRKVKVFDLTPSLSPVRANLVSFVGLVKYTSVCVSGMEFPNIEPEAFTKALIL